MRQSCLPKIIGGGPMLPMKMRIIARASKPVNTQQVKKRGKIEMMG